MYKQIVKQYLEFIQEGTYLRESVLFMGSVFSYHTPCSAVDDIEKFNYKLERFFEERKKDKQHEILCELYIPLRKLFGQLNIISKRIRKEEGWI